MGKTSIPIRTPEPVLNDLGLGSRGDDVLKLQQRLSVLGFFFTSEDGIYGANTQNAVREFENYIRLLEQDEIDRVIEANKTPEPTETPEPSVAPEAATVSPSLTVKPEPTSADSLPEGTLTPAVTPVPTPEPSPVPTPGTPADGIADTSLQEILYGEADALYRRDVSLNDKGLDVMRIQRRLVRLNYLNDEPDGMFGINTENAIKLFQNHHDLNATGLADRTTQQALFSEYVYVAEKPVYNQLYLGVTGNDVKALQNQLRILGFTNSKASGTFDAKTKAAVELLERHLHQLEMMKQGLIKPEPEGTAVPEAILENQGTVEGDPETNPYEVLPEEEGEITSAADNPSPSVQPEASAAPTEEAEMNDQPTARPDADEPEAPESGKSTETAAPDATETPDEEEDTFVPAGIVTAEMQVLLFEEGIPVYIQTLQKGDSGEQVQRIQRRLYSLGYLTANGVDGIFGKGTYTAVMDFQHRNGLAQTGVADQEMQSVLFSEDAVKAMKPYQIRISVDKQRVYVYTYDEQDEYSILVQEFKCSTGTKSNPTPLGTFTNTGPGARWHYFKKFECWAQYAYYIDGDIMFHSVLYDEMDEDTLRKGSVSALGSRASHGCVRLQVKDAQWIYENCKAGTTVIVY